MKYLILALAMLFTTTAFADKGYDVPESDKDFIDAAYLVADGELFGFETLVLTTLRCPLQKLESGQLLVGAWAYGGAHIEEKFKIIGVACADLMRAFDDEDGRTFVPFHVIPSGQIIPVPVDIFKKK